MSTHRDHYGVCHQCGVQNMTAAEIALIEGSRPKKPELRWKPYPQIANFLALEGDTIQACPMMPDGSRDGDESICDVDDEAQLFQDICNPPHAGSEQDDWRQALRIEIQS